MITLEDGGMFDEDTMPDWMKTMRGVAPDKHQVLASSSAPFIPVPEGIPPSAAGVTPGIMPGTLPGEMVIPVSVPPPGLPPFGLPPGPPPQTGMMNNGGQGRELEDFFPWSGWFWCKSDRK